MDNLTNKEAALTWGTVGATVGAAIVLLRAFGVVISDEQEDALLQFAAIGLPLIVALIIRGFVWSKASVETKVDEAHALGQQGASEPPKVV